MGRIRSFRILLAFLFLTWWQTFSSPPNCSASQWDSLGPNGGDVRAIAVDPVSPATIYVGTRLGGVFKTTNAGATWQAANNGLPIAQRDVLALAIDPFSPNHVYAGLGYGGIFKTTDGGRSWAESNEGWPTYFRQQAVHALAIDPAVPGIVYAGTDTGGIFRTMDGGQSWLQYAFTDWPVEAIAIDPFSPTNVYAGVNGSGGLFQSSDRGTTWKQTSLSGFILIQAIAISNSIPGRIYVGFDTGRIVTSADGGATWDDIHLSDTGRAPNVISLALSPESPPTIYAGTSGGGLFYRTESSPWLPAEAGLSDQSVNAIAIGLAGVVFAGTTGQGLFMSTDGGVTWKQRNSGLTAEYVDAIAADPRDSSIAYAALGDLGVYKTSNGADWQAAGTGLPATGVTSLGVSSNSEIYAGTYQGLFHSADAGAGWLSSGLDGESIRALVLDRNSPATLYVASHGDVFRSSDAGASWTRTNVGGVLALALAPDQPDTVYAASWPTVCPGACPPGRLLKTSNGGRDWATLEGLTNIRSVLVDPNAPNVVYAGPRPGGGVFKSIDGGANWMAVGSDTLPSAVSVLASSADSVLYAGTTEAGVFQSLDGGLHWTNIADGLRDLRISSLAVAGPSLDRRLYAGTYGSGIFRLEGLRTVIRPRSPRLVRPRE